MSVHHRRRCSPALNTGIFRSFHQIQSVACKGNRHRQHDTEQARQAALLRARAFERWFIMGDRDAPWNPGRKVS